MFHFISFISSFSYLSDWLYIYTFTICMESGWDLDELCNLCRLPFLLQAGGMEGGLCGRWRSITHSDLHTSIIHKQRIPPKVKWMRTKSSQFPEPINKRFPSCVKQTDHPMVIPLNLIYFILSFLRWWWRTDALCCFYAFSCLKCL